MRAQSAGPVLFSALLAWHCAAPKDSEPDPAARSRAIRSEMLHACVQSNGTFWYQTSGEVLDCRAPSPVIWPRNAFPLRVEVDVPEGCPFQGSPREAVKLVNESLGFKAFRLVRGLSRSSSWTPPDVLIQLCADPESAPVPGLLGLTIHLATSESEDHPAAALVLMWNVGDDRTAAMVLAHELGHVLGLAHDQDERGSIMYPGVAGFFYLSRFTYEDRELMQGLYGPVVP